MNEELKKYYEYLKGAKADVPPDFDSFATTLADEAQAKTYFDYLKANKFDTPDTFDSFSETFGLKKKSTSSLESTPQSQVVSQSTTPQVNESSTQESPSVSSEVPPTPDLTLTTPQTNPFPNTTPKSLITDFLTGKPIPRDNPKADTPIESAGSVPKELARAFGRLFDDVANAGRAVESGFAQLFLGKEGADAYMKVKDNVALPNSMSLHPAQALSGFLTESTKNLKDIPTGVVGNVSKGMLDLVPDIASTLLFPEGKVFTLAPKIGLNLGKFGMEQAMRGYAQGIGDSEGGSVGLQLKMPVVTALEKGAMGWMYETMGGINQQFASKLAGRLLPKASVLNQSLLQHGTVSTLDGFTFGGLGSLDEYLRTGKMTSETFFTGFGTGVAFHAMEGGKLLLAKGYNTLLGMPSKGVTQLAKSEMSVEEMNKQADEKIDLLNTGKSENPEGDAVMAFMLKKSAQVKAVSEEVLNNKDEVIKDIKANVTDTKTQEALIDKINEVDADNDPKIQETKEINDKIAKIDDALDLIKGNKSWDETRKEIESAPLKEKKAELKAQALEVYGIKPEVKKGGEGKKEEKPKAPQTDLSEKTISEIEKPIEEPKVEEVSIPIRDMNSEQLRNLARKEKKSQASLEEQFFGKEGVKQYREARDKGESMTATLDQRKAAYAITEQFDNSLSKEQYDELYGLTSEKQIDPSEIRDIASRVELIEQSENVQDLGGALKLPLLDFINNQTNEGTLAVLNAAKKKAVELDVNPKEMLESAIKRIAKDLPDLEDAKLLADEIINKIINPTEQNTVSQPALQENKQQALENTTQDAKIPSETGQNANETKLSSESDSNIPPEPPIVEKSSGEQETDTKFRKTQTNALIQDQTRQQEEVTKIVDANKERYNVLHGEDAVVSAKQMIGEQGVANATVDLTEKTKRLDEFPIRQVGRMVLLDFYSRAIIDPSASEIDKQIAFKNIDKLQQITAREATSAGQGNSMLAIWKSMQPTGVLEFVRRKVEESNTKQLDKKIGDTTIGQQIDELYKTLTDESKKIIDDIIAGRQVRLAKEGEKPTTEKAQEPKPRKTVPKERIKIEQEYRKNLIEQYKKSQSGTMSLSVTGLSSAQIELAGNFLASYVREGAYRAQDFIDSLKKDFKGIGVELDDKQALELLDSRKDNKERYNDFAERKESAARTRAGEKLASKKIDSVLREHFTEKDELKRTLAQKLMDEAGLTEAEAKKIEKEVLEKFDEEITKRSEEQLTKLIGTSKIPTEKKTVSIKDQMIDMINMGALDKELYTDLFSEKFHLTKLSDEHKMEILKLANNVQEASGKGWLERDATIKLAKYIYELYPKDKRGELIDTWTSLAYANMLSGPFTSVLNIWSQGSNLSLRPVRELLNLSKWLKTVKRGMKGEGWDVYNPFGEMFYVPMAKGSAMGWNEAKEVYLNGDLNNKYVEDIAKKGQFKVTPLERDKYGKAKRFKPLTIGGKDFNIFNGYKYAGRNLAAQDKWMLATSYDTEIASILRDNLRTRDLTREALTKAVMDIYRGNHINQKELDAQLESDIQLHKKLTGDDMTEIQKKIRRRELVLEKLPLTKDERDEAEQLARGNIFTDERHGFFGTLAKGLSIASNSSPVTGLIMKPYVPFTLVVGNVSEYMMDHTPIYGFLRANGYSVSGLKKLVNPEWQTAQMGEAGSRAWYEQMGRAWFGTLAFGAALAFLLGKDDDDKIKLSGGYSTEGLKKPGRENTMPKYTLSIYGVEIPYMNIPSLAIPLAIIGNLNDGLKANMDEGELADRLTAALMIDAGLQSVTMIKDMSFVDGVERLATLVGNAASTDEKKWGQIGKDVAKTYLGFVTRPLPQNNNAVQQVWKIFDPTAYSQSDISSMLAYTAGLQHFVGKPKVDQLGDEVQSYPGETLLPYTHWMNIKGKDERWKFLAEHNAIPGKGANRVFQIETKTGVEKRKLDEEELYDYTNRAGTLFSQHLKSYMSDKKKVAERSAEIIERDKGNGEMEKVNGVRVDMEKAWANAKKDAETELFKWGSVKEEKPAIWELIKKNEAYQVYQASKKTGDYTWDKSELYEFNNRATLRYADKVQNYLQGATVEADKKKPMSKEEKALLLEDPDYEITGDTKFDYKIGNIWKLAKKRVTDDMTKQILAKQKSQKPKEK